MESDRERGLMALRPEYHNFLPDYKLFYAVVSVRN